MNRAEEKTRVAVCVITYKRPEGLRRLLEGLDRLRFEKVEAPELEVVLVDNDPAGSACASGGAASGYAYPLRCFVEPRRGIPHARNTALAAVDGGVDFVAFVDDDEVPEPGWLDELLSVQRLCDADVVAGPVVRHFEEEPPAWVVEGGFFVKQRYATGQRIKYPDTANALVRWRVLEEMDEHFDERMALSGGEDTHLFLRMHRAGRTMVWADGGVVHELIPRSKANAAWILRRAYRLGNSLSICEVDVYPGDHAFRALRVAKATARIARGTLLLAVSPLRGKHASVRALQDVFRGVGMLAGLVGFAYQEYAKTHGK